MNTSYVCVECGASVPHLVRDYGKGNVRLAICNHCNAIADKYVEYEHVLLFLDVMLFKPQVYRHILYNLPSPPSFRMIFKLFIILVMLDMNTKAYLIDRKQGVIFRSESMYHENLFLNPQELSGFRISAYSLHLVCLAFFENVVMIVSVFVFIWLDPFQRQWYTHLSRQMHHVDCQSVSYSDSFMRFNMALVISSFGKLFALLNVIWEFHWSFIYVVGMIVMWSNTLALQLLVGETSISPSIITVVLWGLFMRFTTQLVLYRLGNTMIFYVFV